MLVRYKRNKKLAFYHSDSLVAVSRPQPIEKPCGPFESCGDCPYASHGFMCYGKEGDCLRTDMQKFDRRKAVQENAQANPPA